MDIDITYDLEKLYQNYADLVTGEYKAALVNLKETNTKWKPPEINVGNATPLDAAQHIQECSGYYGVVCVLASYAKSAQEMAEAQYKTKMRSHIAQSDKKNAESREAEAASYCIQELNNLLFFQSALHLFSALEKNARAASDSSRKIAEMINSHHIAEIGNKT